MSIARPTRTKTKKMFDTRTKITNLEATVEGLKKFEADFKARYEEAKSHRVHVEVELNAKVLSKDGDLAGKDTEIPKLKRMLREAQDVLDAEKKKVESLGIDLEAEKVKAETAEEARRISTSALNVAYTNYVEAQSIMDTLLADSEWMQSHGVAHVSNSILNATELDKAVAALTMAHFGTRHCSVSDQADLVKAEEIYNNLSLPMMDLVTEALKHNDYVLRLRSIFKPPEIVE
ncbi:hypothetical protein Hanom_Chr05g00419281 [Helianthus anomalus]